MTLIGDVGGFNAAIILLPAYVMSYYSARMYEESISQEIPVRRPPKNPRGSQSPHGQTLKERLKSTDAGNDTLEIKDVRELYENVSRTFFLKPDYMRAFLDCLKICCKQSKEAKLRKKIHKRFDKVLDIR